MMNKLKKTIMAGALALAALGSASLASAQDYLRTFTIVNRSSLTIRRIYVSPTSSDRWGSDQLGQYVLNPGYKFSVHLYPGYYDVKYVDQDGDSCTVTNVDFTDSDTQVLTNANLIACEILH